MGIRRIRDVRFGAVVIASVSAFALAGCGTATLDTGKVQDTLKQRFEAHGLTNVSVSCPSNVPAQKGHSFTCKATFTSASGQSGSITYNVDQTDNNGHVEYTATSATGAAAGIAGKSGKSGNSGNSGNSGSSGSSGNSGNS
jgi:hypothetical protein